MKSILHIKKSLLLKAITFCLTWFIVFSLMDKYFLIDSKWAYATVGYCFCLYQVLLDYFFDEPY